MGWHGLTIRPQTIAYTLHANDHGRMFWITLDLLP
jgi:hypothetical protein